MKIKLLQRKLYVNNQRRRRADSQLRLEVRQTGQAGRQSARQAGRLQKYIKNVDIGIHLFNGCARSPRQAQAQLPEMWVCWVRWVSWVCSPLIRQITKVCAASVGAVAWPRAEQ